jgi:hypothetical protein
LPPFAEHEEPEIDEETRRHSEEQQLAELKVRWHKDVASRHLMQARGVEVCYFEFKEVLLAFAVRLRDAIDPKTGKLKVVLSKFMDEWILPRMMSFVKFSIPTSAAKTPLPRTWPESAKEQEIKAILTEKAKLANEERARREALERQQLELARMAEEDQTALDAAEVEALHKRQMAQQEAEQRAKEAKEEEASQQDESSSE